MNNRPSMTWERCIERFESWGKQLREAEIKYAHDALRLGAMRKLISPQHLARDEAMLSLVRILMNDPEIDICQRHISHQFLRLWYPEIEGFELDIQALDPKTYWIGLIECSPHDEFVGNLEAIAHLTKYYLLWLKNLQQNPAEHSLYKILEQIKKLYGQEQELRINKYLSDSSARILPQGLANIRQVVLETIQAISVKQGKEFDPNDNSSSENPSEDALYKVWQILRELYPHELELSLKRNLSELSAAIFAEDLAKMRGLANDAIKTIRAKEFEQFENLKDENND